MKIYLDTKGIKHEIFLLQPDNDEWWFISILRYILIGIHYMLIPFCWKVKAGKE